MFTLRGFFDILSSKLKLDVRYFASGTFWLILNQSVDALKNFTLGIMFANFLSKDVFGKYTFFFTVLSILLMLFSLSGFSNSLLTSLAQKRDGTFNVALKKIFYSSFIGVFALFVFSFFDYYIFKEYNFLIILVSALIFPLYSVGFQYQTLLIGKLKLKQLFLTNLGYSIFTLITMYFVILVNSLSFLISFALITNTLFMCISLYFFKKRYINNDIVDYKNLKFGLQTSFSRGFNSALLYLSSILIVFVLGFENLAIYTFAISIPIQIRYIWKNINPLLIRKMTLLQISSKTLLYYYWLIFFGVTIFIIIYFFFGRLIFDIFYKQYSQFFILSFIYSFSSLAFPGLFLQSFISSKNKTKEFIIQDIVSSLLNLGLCIILIFRFGLYGVMIANVISNIFISVYLYIRIKFFYNN